MLNCSTKYKISQGYSHLLKIYRPTKLVQKSKWDVYYVILIFPSAIRAD